MPLMQGQFDKAARVQEMTICLLQIARTVRENIEREQVKLQHIQVTTKRLQYVYPRRKKNGFATTRKDVHHCEDFL